MNDKKYQFNLTWQTKKYMAILSCSVIVLSGIVVSSNSNKKASTSTAEYVSTSIDTSSGKAEASVDLGCSVITSKSNNSDTNSKENKREVLEQNEEETPIATTSSPSDNSQSSNKRSKNSVTQIAELSENEQIPNKVSAANDETDNAPKLCSTIFENHGEVPTPSEYSILYQYPIEPGYHTDNNFDGKQTSPYEDLMKMVFKTTPDGEDEELSSEEVAEQERLEKFRENIYKEVLPTEPIEQSKELNAGSIKKEISHDNAEEETTESDTNEGSLEEATDNIEGTSEITQDSNSTETNDNTEAASTEDSNKTEEIKEITIDAGNYIVKGPIRDDYLAFVDDVTITPSGKNGFNKIRYGKDGDFKDDVVLQAEVANKEIDLYFTDGTDIIHSTFTYSIDRINPSIKAKKDDKIKVITCEYGDIYCTNDNTINFDIDDDEKSSGISKATLVYGDKIGYIFEGLDKPQYKMTKPFYGRTMYSCNDNAGNASELTTQYYLIEDTAPTIQVSESDICSAPYNLAVKVSDTGSIVSGIDSIVCTINGEEYTPDDLICDESVRLADYLDVPSKSQFSIKLPDVGTYDIDITVTDHCGNVNTLHKTLDVTEPELVAVYMPDHFSIHIDPEQLAGREQIYSDNIHLQNVSNVDVKVSITLLDLFINRQTYENDVVKDCTIYMVCPDTGEKILLEKGKNENVYSFRLPQNAEGDISDIYFVGETSEGSELLWEDSDISMHIDFSFDKWDEESEMTEE